MAWYGDEHAQASPAAPGVGLAVDPDLILRPGKAARDGNADSTRRGSVKQTDADGAAIAVVSEAAERWAALYTQLRPNLMRALAATCGTYEGVEDAIQEAFASALKQAPADLRSPEAWLFVVALNKMRNQQRRTRLAVRLRLTAPAQPHELDDALRRADVVSALQKLTSRERDLLIAKYYVGMSQEEIAQYMGIARGTVASGVSRAAARFRDLDKPNE
jgi:RNA polymerase sigma-70 factor, ECF subfamily